MDTSLDKSSKDPFPTFVNSILSEKTQTTPADNARDRLLAWAQTRFGNEEIVRAKEEFFWKTGKVFYDDSFYETRMEYFVDYFLLERPLSVPHEGDICLTPYHAYQKLVDQNLMSELEGFRHSLFQIAKVTEKKLIGYDLINDKKIEVFARPQESFRAIFKKEFMQGFVYTSELGTHLSQGMIFHPLKANRFIRKQLKTSKNATDFDASTFLSALAKLQLRHLRHAHVDPRRIYCLT